jgi:predicted esterase
MSKESSLSKMEVRSDADLQAIQTSVAFKNISDAIEQYRRHFGVAFLALIAFSAIHVGLVVIANLYTLQTRVSHGVLTSTTDDSAPVATSSVVERYDLQYIMTNMNEVQQLKALRQLHEASFTDKAGNFRQYSVTGFQLGGWRRSDLKLFTSVGHVLHYNRGSGLRVLSENGTTSTGSNVTEHGRKLLQDASISNDAQSSTQLAQEVIQGRRAKEARWSSVFQKSTEQYTVSDAVDKAYKKALMQEKQLELLEYQLHASSPTEMRNEVTVLTSALTIDQGMAYTNKAGQVVSDEMVISSEALSATQKLKSDIEYYSSEIDSDVQKIVKDVEDFIKLSDEDKTEEINLNLQDVTRSIEEYLDISVYDYPNLPMYTKSFAEEDIAALKEAKPEFTGDMTAKFEEWGYELESEVNYALDDLEAKVSSDTQLWLDHYGYDALPYVPDFDDDEAAWNYIVTEATDFNEVSLSLFVKEIADMHNTVDTAEFVNHLDNVVAELDGVLDVEIDLFQAEVADGFFGQSAAKQYSSYAAVDGGQAVLVFPDQDTYYGCTGLEVTYIDYWWNMDVSLKAEILCGERAHASYDPIIPDNDEYLHPNMFFNPWFKGYMFSSVLGYVEEFTIYFPPTYCDEGSPKVPSIFMLHGFGGDEEFLYFIARAMDYCFSYFWSIGRSNDVTNSLMAPPFGFVVTCPRDGSGPWGKKSWYLNTLFTGFHMDFIAFELRGFVWKEARVLGSGESKSGVFGFSMGGFGSFNIGFAYPGLFGFVGAFNGPSDGNDCFYTKTCFLWCMVDTVWCEILWSSVAIVFNPIVIMRAGSDINSPDSSSPMMHGNAVDLMKRGHYTLLDVWDVFGEGSYPEPSSYGAFVGCMMTKTTRETGSGNIVPSVYVPMNDQTIASTCTTLDKDGDTHDFVVGASTASSSTASSWMAVLKVMTGSPNLNGPPPTAEMESGYYYDDKEDILPELFCGMKYGCVMYCLEEPRWYQDKMVQFAGSEYDVNFDGSNTILFWVNPVYSTMATQYFCPPMNVLTDELIEECYMNMVDGLPLGMISNAKEGQFGSPDNKAYWVFQSCDVQDEYGVYIGTVAFAGKWLQHMAENKVSFAQDVYVFDHTGLYGHEYCQDDIRKTIGMLSEYFFTRVMADPEFDLSAIVINWDYYDDYGHYGKDGGKEGDYYGSYDHYDSSSTRRLLSQTSGRSLLAGDIEWRPPAPPTSLYSNDYDNATIAACTDDSTCTPMCFTQSLYITEAHGMFEKVKHNGLDQDEQLNTPSTLCAMSRYVGKLGSIKGYSMTEGVEMGAMFTDYENGGANQPVAQPTAFFTDAEFEAGSAHLEASSSHGAIEDLVGEFGDNGVPDGSIIYAPTGYSGTQLTLWWEEQAEREAEVIANMTASMEDAIFASYGTYWEHDSMETSLYECNTQILNLMISGDTETTEMMTSGNATIIYSVYEDMCPSDEELSEQQMNLAESLAQSQTESDSPTMTYYRFYKAEPGFSGGWLEMTQDEVVLSNLENLFDGFESLLAEHAYSHDDCVTEMQKQLTAFAEMEGKLDKLYAKEETFFAQRDASEEARTQAMCADDEILIQLTQEFKSFKGAAGEAMCISATPESTAWTALFNYVHPPADLAADVPRTVNKESYDAMVAAKCADLKAMNAEVMYATDGVVGGEQGLYVIVDGQEESCGDAAFHEDWNAADKVEVSDSGEVTSRSIAKKRIVNIESCEPQANYDFWTINFFEYVKAVVLGYATDEDFNDMVAAFEAVEAGTYDEWKGLNKDKMTWVSPPPVDYGPWLK